MSFLSLINHGVLVFLLWLSMTLRSRFGGAVSAAIKFLSVMSFLATEPAGKSITAMPEPPEGAPEGNGAKRRQHERKKDVNCGFRSQKSLGGLGCMSLLLVKKGGVGGNVCDATNPLHTGTKA